MDTVDPQPAVLVEGDSYDIDVPGPHAVDLGHVGWHRPVIHVAAQAAIFEAREVDADQLNLLTGTVEHLVSHDMQSGNSARSWRGGWGGYWRWRGCRHWGGCRRRGGYRRRGGCWPWSRRGCWPCRRGGRWPCRRRGRWCWRGDRGRGWSREDWGQRRKRQRRSHGGGRGRGRPRPWRWRGGRAPCRWRGHGDAAVRATRRGCVT